MNDATFYIASLQWSSRTLLSLAFDGVCLRFSGQLSHTTRHVPIVSNDSSNLAGIQEAQLINRCQDSGLQPQTRKKSDKIIISKEEIHLQGSGEAVVFLQ